MDQQTLVQKIDQFSADLSLFNRAVHGSETETVLLGGVPTPSYRKLVADVDARESQAAKLKLQRVLLRCRQSQTVPPSTWQTQQLWR